MSFGFGHRLPNSRALPPAGGGGAAVNWPTLFGATQGFAYDGTQSHFWSDVGMTTDATVSGTTPTAVIEDVSGNGHHAWQNQTNNMPIYYTDGAVKSILYGTLNGGQPYCTMIVGDGAFYSTTAQTIIAVVRNVANGGNGTNLLTNYNGGWSEGTYFGLRYVNGTTASFLANNNASTQPECAAALATNHIIVARRSGLGTNESTLAVYDMTGQLLTSATGSNNIGNQGPLRLGANVSGSGKARMSLMAYLKRHLTDEEVASTVASVAFSHGGWTV